jgi:hypothetical protein
MNCVPLLIICVASLPLFLEPARAGQNDTFSSEASIALASQMSGSDLAKNVSRIDITLRTQAGLIPLLQSGSPSDLVIVESRLIKRFFSALWNPADVTSEWSGPDCSMAVRITVAGSSPAYFHVYLRAGKVPLVTPWTGSDSATYANASILKLFEELGLDVKHKARLKSSS